MLNALRPRCAPKVKYHSRLFSMFALYSDLNIGPRILGSEYRANTYSPSGVCIEDTLRKPLWGIFIALHDSEQSMTWLVFPLVVFTVVSQR